MSLKLFRSTGYASILSPGETRVATHPGWLMAAVSAWVGFACNVALWRAFVAGWRDLGATHLCLSTMGNGFTSPDEHLAALTRAAEVLEVQNDDRAEPIAHGP